VGRRQRLDRGADSETVEDAVDEVDVVVRDVTSFMSRSSRFRAKGRSRRGTPGPMARVATRRSRSFDASPGTGATVAGALLLFGTEGSVERGADEQVFACGLARAPTPARRTAAGVARPLACVA
jgi:hypothetical protein